jgi:hypothetical protein
MHGQLFNQLIVAQTGDQQISSKAAYDEVIEIIHHVLGS